MGKTTKAVGTGVVQGTKVGTPMVLLINEDTAFNLGMSMAWGLGFCREIRWKACHGCGHGWWHAQLLMLVVKSEITTTK